MRFATRSLVVTGAVLGVLLLAGCYGSTDPATNVGATSATLNGRGTANAGSAQVYFEYWLTADPNHRATTPAATVPAGAAGPFTRPVSGLRANQSYSYRLCAKDSSTPAGGTCAQSVSFVPRGNIVRVFGNAEAAGDPSQPNPNSYEDVGVNATSGPAGEAPQGQGSYTDRNTKAGTFRFGSFGSPPPDNVTCVYVSGNVAIIGLENVPTPPEPGLRFEGLKFVDGGPGQPDQIAAYGPSADTNGKDCATYTYLVTQPFTSGGVTIEHAAAAPTAQSSAARNSRRSGGR